MKFFRYQNTPTKLKIDRGNLKLEKTVEDYFIKYADTLDGDININQQGDTVSVSISRDFPREEPVSINLNGLSDCDVRLENGSIDAIYVCPRMKIGISNGSLSAKLSKDEVGIVKAHVGVGVVNNSSSLTQTQNEQPVYNFMHMGHGFNNNVELAGVLDHSVVSFEVGCGTIDLL